MSTALAVAEPEMTLDAKTLESLVVGGDLSKLSSAQRLQYYRARCDAAGVDERTQPFQYLQLQGKLTLYATKTCTDQLIASKHLTVQIVDRKLYTETGVYEVQCRVTRPDGSSVDDMGVVWIGGAKGNDLCNGMLKAVTKAKRRTVLSACGLGMLDESELETIPGALQSPQAAPLPPELKDVHGKDIDAYEAWCSDYVSRTNARWIDRWVGPGGEIPAEIHDLISTHQLTGHLVKHFVQQGVIPETGDVSHRNRLKVATKLWLENQGALKAEAKRYVAKLAAERTAEQAERDGDNEADPDISDDGEEVSP